jgi:hypothetical protein
MMSNAIDTPLDEGAPLVDPPLVDDLYLDDISDAYTIVFVPDDRVSRKQKEIVVVSRNSQDGRRIELRLKQLAGILGAPVVRLFHSGGGDFGFSLSDGREIHLSDESGSAERSRVAYVQLQDLGMIAQIAFREDQLLKNQTR